MKYGTFHAKSPKASDREAHLGHDSSATFPDVREAQFAYQTAYIHLAYLKELMAKLLKKPSARLLVLVTALSDIAADVFPKSVTNAISVMY